MKDNFVPRYIDKEKNILVNIDNNMVFIYDLRNKKYMKSSLYKNHLNEFFYSRFEGKTKMYKKKDLIPLSLEEVFKYVNQF